MQWPRVEVEVGSEQWLPYEGPRPSWRIGLTDTTLRDGLQGFRPLTVREALSIYEVLAELSPEGVIESTELFLYTEEQRRIVRAILETGWEYPRPIAWIRSTLSDARLAVDSGLGETVVLASVGPLHVREKLGVTWQRAVEKYLSVVEYLASHGVSVRIALEDFTRSEFTERVVPFVLQARSLAERHGVGFRVKLSDTLGLAMPFPSVPAPRGVWAAVWRLRNSGLRAEEIEFHGHNDLGLVVANQLAAWLAGASWANCTLLGVGERAGNCPLEVMLLHYASLTGDTIGVRLDRLPRVVEVMERLGVAVPPWYPVVGRNAFNTKAGIHVDGLLKNPRIYLPYHPGLVGRRATVEVTPLGGRSALIAWLRSRGVDVGKDDPRVEALYRALAAAYPAGPHEAMTLLEEEARRFFPELAG